MIANEMYVVDSFGLTLISEIFSPVFHQYLDAFFTGDERLIDVPLQMEVSLIRALIGLWNIKKNALKKRKKTDCRFNIRAKLITVLNL